MITWNSFKDSTPKQEILDQCDNKILICDTYSGDGGSFCGGGSGGDW